MFPLINQVFLLAPFSSSFSPLLPNKLITLITPSFRGKLYGFVAINCVVNSQLFIAIFEMQNIQESKSKFLALLSNSGLLDKLRAEHYDVAIAQCFEECIFGVFEHLGISSKIGTSPMSLLELIGARYGIPTIPSYVVGMQILHLPTDSYSNFSLQFLFFIMNSSSN